MTRPAGPARADAGPAPALPYSGTPSAPPPCAPENRRFLLIAAILASALGFIDSSVVAIALPAMRDSLGATLPQAQWISNAYLLALSALILVGGAAGDRFGPARVFGAGIALFMLASLACTLATGPPAMIAARAVQGLGAAAMVPGALALIARAYPPGERGAAIGLWAASSAVTTALGPLAGGVLLTFGGPDAWRAIFAVNLPLGAVALWLLATKVTRDPARPATRLDLPGAALAALALGALAAGLTGAEHGATAIDLGLVALGLAALAGFVATERAGTQPMIPLRLFADRAFAAANTVTFVLYFALTTILFFLPMTAIAGWGLTAMEPAAAFAPLSLFVGARSPAMGRLAERVGAGRLIAPGAALVAAACAAMAASAPAQAFWAAVFPAAMAMGLGMALVVAPLSAVVMARAGEHTGAASGINNALARMAGLLAVAAMGPVAAAAYAGRDGPDSFGAALSGPDAAHAAASAAGFAAVAWCAAGLAALAALLAWLTLPPRGG